MRLPPLHPHPARPVRVVESRCALGESPLWLSVDRGVRWIDAEGGDLHALRHGTHDRWHVTDRLLTAVAPTEAGDLLLVVDRQVWRRPDGPHAAATVLAELPVQSAGTRFNDAKVGPDGRLWAGTMNPRRPAAGALWSVTADGMLHRHWTGIGHGNGIAWSPAGDTLYFVDSGAGTLSRGAFDIATGVGAATVITRIPRTEGIPDGLTVDADGELWLALWGGGCLLRLSPDGEPLARVELPDRNVTSAAFVGADLDLLAVTTAADDVSADGTGGSLYLLDIGRRGLPGYLFGTGGPRLAPDPSAPETGERR